MYFKKENPSTTAAGGFCLAIIGVVILGLILVSAIIMGVWNWVFVPIFGIESITWGQAFLLYLGLMLVGGAFRRVTK